MNLSTNTRIAIIAIVNQVFPVALYLVLKAGCTNMQKRLSDRNANELKNMIDAPSVKTLFPFSVGIRKNKPFIIKEANESVQPNFLLNSKEKPATIVNNGNKKTR
jgi:hypothetical protein